MGIKVPTHRDIISEAVKKDEEKLRVEHADQDDEEGEEDEEDEKKPSDKEKKEDKKEDE